MKKELVFVVIYFISVINNFGQKSDTIYYNKEWKECNKELSFYYGFKFLDSEFTGVEKYYYNNGQMHSYKNIMNGHEHGSVSWWYLNGEKWCEGNYKNGVEHGKWIFYHENGLKSAEDVYNMGKKGKDSQGWDEEGNVLIDYLVVDKKPLFGGRKSYKKSEKALNEYVAKYTKYPDIARRKGIETRVLIRFVIDEKGKVCDVKVEESGNYILEQKAIEIIENLPDWTPGVHNRKNVRVPLVIPINFKLR